ncbi:hypothetical protein CCAX7_38690 [Capsulimonas corticalis]|uniref:Uncharacterized protein n=1 Tax=Capsulimonas corticalis TaxID=2219043 RepID=A0A402D3U9_9BACT|nr:hypothetical protein CCAX7_38690 [Capsulimonas corticalis]
MLLTAPTAWEYAKDLGSTDDGSGAALLICAVASKAGKSKSDKGLRQEPARRRPVLRALRAEKRANIMAVAFYLIRYGRGKVAFGIPCPAKRRFGTERRLAGHGNFPIIT